MGIDGKLVLVDHEGAVVQGRAAAEAALGGDPAPLRTLLLDMEFWVNEEKLEEYQRRLAKLQELQAPDLILRPHERWIAQLDGRAFSRGVIERASTPELLWLLGNWNRPGADVELNKGWDLLHFYADQGRRDRGGPSPGEPRSPLDVALYGSVPVPILSNGQPLIHDVGGS